MVQVGGTVRVQGRGGKVRGQVVVTVCRGGVVIQIGDS